MRFTVTWRDGSSSEVQINPDGSLAIIGYADPLRPLFGAAPDAETRRALLQNLAGEAGAEVIRQPDR
jgi:hypothetical protein